MRKQRTHPKLTIKQNRFNVKLPPLLQGIVMTIPDDIPMPTEERTPDSVAVFVCPRCHTERFISERFLDLLKELPTIHEAIEQAFPRHRPCNAIMRLEPLHPPDP